VKLDAARAFALSLPEVTEQPHWGSPSFRVKGKIFCTIPESGHGRTLRVFVDEDEIRAAVDEDPATFEAVWWGKQLSGVDVRLAKAKTARVRELLEDAWRLRATATLLKEYDSRA
jgi:hypothetical protein